MCSAPDRPVELQVAEFGGCARVLQARIEGVMQLCGDDEEGKEVRFGEVVRGGFTGFGGWEEEGMWEESGEVVGGWVEGYCGWAIR